MTRLKLVGLESHLEIDKLKNAEDAANKSGEYDMLYHELNQDEVVKKAKEEKENQGNDTSATGKAVPVDDGADGESGSSDMDDGQTDIETDTETEEALESFRRLTYSGESVTIAASATLDFVVLLGILGIRFSGDIVKHVYKGLAFLFAGAAKIIYQSSKLITEYLDKREESLDNIKKSIKALKNAMSELEASHEEKDITGLKFDQKQTINTLKAGNSVDFKENINQLTVFTEKYVRSLFSQLRHEQESISHIMAAGRTKAITPPLNLMPLHTDALGLTKGEVTGYSVSSEFVTPFRSNAPLPSDVVVIGYFPREELEDKDEITKAYNDSSMILGIDTETFQKVDAIDYMTFDQLSGFLDQLDTLCSFLINQKSEFEKIKHTKETLKISLKNYFMQLAHEPKRVSVANSFMDLVYLKVMISDKVYLTSSIDFQDYVSKALVAGTRFAKQNIEVMS